ncbi:MAG: hypothetical protein KF830_05325 [Planctomycetes bacterium]|nr:hypothetical protein [Planctomycetota bacterium]
MTGHRRFAPVLRDALCVAAVAVLTVQALRRHAGDRYRVPSGSMQPVLHGDPVHGDVVFVDKLAAARRRQRHDLVVVRHPEQPGQQMVKRLAARGDDVDACCIDIRGGDLWLGPDAQRLQRERKDPLAARALRVRWAAWPAEAAALAGGLDLSATVAAGSALVLPPLRDGAGTVRGLFAAPVRQERRNALAGGVLPQGFAGTARAVDATFVDANGVRSRTGEDVGVADCGLELDLLQPVDEFLGTIDARDQALTVCWRAASGTVELWSDGELVAGAQLPHRPTGRQRIEFGLLDDQVFFLVDGRRDALAVWPRQADWPSSRRGDAPSEPRTHVHVACTGAWELRLGRLVVFRDVFYWRERIAGFPGDRGQWPRCLPAGTWFLLGDNTFDSRDSRHFDAVPMSSFLGVPWFVLGPWPRLRWLPA